ncbi:MAG: outer membrane beta-barrel protein [Gemmatimonadaceae bacterium]
MSRTRCGALLLVVALPLTAQEAPAPTTDEQIGKWGIGISLSPVSIFIDEVGLIPIGFNNFLMPIRVGAATTLEPEFGLFRSSSSSSGAENSFNNLRVGVGLLMPLRERASLRPYTGGRVGVSRTTTESIGGFGGSQKTRQNSWHMSAVLGAQHFFTRHFSLGGEVQLTRTSVGEQTGGSSPTGTAQSFVTTGGVMMLRWFF